MKAKLTFDVSKDGQQYKLTKIEGVEISRNLPDEYKDRGPRFQMDAAGSGGIFVQHQHEGFFGGKVYQIGHVFTKSQHKDLMATLKDAGDRLTAIRRKEREAKAKAQPALPVGEIVITKTDTACTVTDGVHTATMKWKKEGENYRLDGVEGDVMRSASNWGDEYAPLSICSDNDLRINTSIETASLLVPSSHVHLPYQCDMWNQMFVAACTEYFRTLSNPTTEWTETAFEI